MITIDEVFGGLFFGLCFEKLNVSQIKSTFAKVGPKTGYIEVGL